MDVGIFSGSFNPIHIGHLALANYLCEFEGLDELWFLVTPRNPFKVGQDLMPDELRLELVRLAVEDYPKFRASDFEFHLPRPSYTIHTFEKLKEAYPTVTFHLIIGSDNWLSFPQLAFLSPLVSVRPPRGGKSHPCLSASRLSGRRFDASSAGASGAIPRVRNQLHIHPPSLGGREGHPLFPPSAGVRATDSVLDVIMI